MQHWFAFKLSILAGSLFVTNALLGCGSVDPSDDPPQAGAGGEAPTPAEGGAGGVSGGNGASGSDGNAGAGADAGGGGGQQPLGALLPWAVGNTWTYEVTNDGVVTEKTTTIEAEEEVGGTGPNADLLAFHVITAKGADLADRTESWQAPNPENPDRIERYREQSFSASTGDLKLEEHWDPAKLHIDGSAERTLSGASWLERYDETKLEVGLPPTTHAVSERWTVISDDETVEVPAGTFEHCIHLQKVGSGSSKDYWYLRGVGKIKETGSQTEELVEYSIEEQAP